MRTSIAHRYLENWREHMHGGKIQELRSALRDRKEGEKAGILTLPGS
jgi:hypothetical protein